MNAGFFNYNADRCESAKGPKCTCHCGGMLHGMHHSPAWRAQALSELRLDDQPQLDSGLLEVAVSKPGAPPRR